MCIYDVGGGLITAAMGLNLPPTDDKTPKRSPANETAMTVSAVFRWTDFRSKLVSVDDMPSI